MRYKCKNCGNVLREFDVGFDKNLKRKTKEDPKNCMCEDCNLGKVPKKLVQFNPFNRIVLLFFQMMYPALILAIFILEGLTMGILMDTSKLEKVIESSFVLYFAIKCVLQIIAYISADYIDGETRNKKRTVKVAIAYTLTTFADMVILALIIASTSNPEAFEIFEDIRYLKMPGAFIHVVMAIGLYIDATKNILVSILNIDFEYYEIGSHYEATTSDGVTSVKEVTDYDGNDGLGFFLGLTVGVWGIFYWIIKSIKIAVRYASESKYLDKHLIKAYRKTVNEYPKMYFYGYAKAEKERKKYNGKIYEINKKYSYCEPEFLESLKKKVKVPSHKEKLNFVEYYDIVKNENVVTAKYKKDGKQYSIEIIDGQKIYDK